MAGKIKTDCFAYKNNNAFDGCDCLKQLYCKESECRFYKSKEEYKEQNGCTYEQMLIQLKIK